MKGGIEDELSPIVVVVGKLRTVKLQRCKIDYPRKVPVAH